MGIKHLTCSPISVSFNNVNKGFFIGPLSAVVGQYLTQLDYIHKTWLSMCQFYRCKHQEKDVELL